MLGELTDRRMVEHRGRGDVELPAELAEQAVAQFDGHPQRTPRGDGRDGGEHGVGHDELLGRRQLMEGAGRQRVQLSEEVRHRST